MPPQRSYPRSTTPTLGADWLQSAFTSALTPSVYPQQSSGDYTNAQNMYQAALLGISQGQAMSGISDTTSSMYAPQSTQSVLAPAMGIPSGESSYEPAPSTDDVEVSSEGPNVGTSTIPIGRPSAQNMQQASEQRKNNLIEAFEAASSYDPHGGTPIKGSESTRVKVDAYGRPYTVVSMTPTDEKGRSQKQETIGFGISKPPAGLIGGTGESTFGGGQHSWETTHVNPYTATTTAIPKKKASGAGTSFSDLISQF